MKKTPAAFTRPVSLFLIIFGLAMLSGCGTLRNGRGWGQDATLIPGWQKIKLAAYDAAVAPETWAPAVGSAVLKAAHYDESITRWASKNTPVFGSQENAAKASDYLRDTASVLSIATGLATPSGNEADDWIINKAKGFAVEAGALSLTTHTVDILKKQTCVIRPNGHNNESFPSSHSARAAVNATLASRNIESLNLPKDVKVASQIGLGALTAATAWASVESDWHFPSDVLAGIAIGHFFGAFVTDAFLGIDSSQTVVPTVEPLENGAAVQIMYSF